MLKRVLGSVLILTAVVTAGGCWDRREIESLGFVTMSAVDRAPDGRSVILTSHIAKPIAVITDEPGGIDERPFWVVSTSGRTVGEAHLHLREESPRTPFWAHNLHLVVGRRLAEEGLATALGFFARHFETRRRVIMMVFEGEDTMQLMQAEFDVERLPAVAFKEMLDNNIEYVGTTVITEIQDFLVMLETEGLEPVVGTVMLTPRPPEGDIRGDLQRDEVVHSAITLGAAVFRGDRLQGMLDGTETRGMQWVTAGFRTTEVVIPHPRAANQYVNLRVTRVDTEINVDVNDDVPSVEVEVDVQAEIHETTAFLDPFMNYETLIEMERELAVVVRDEIRAALRAAQGYESDVFGFGRALHCRHPRAWQRLRDEWNEIFADLVVQLRVEGAIMETGLLMRSTRIR